MSVAPFVLVVSAAIMLVLAAWIGRFGRTRGEPAAYVMTWLALSVTASLILAASLWIEDEMVSLSFAAAARSLLMIAAFIAFLFTRSFSRGSDYTLFFWSIPLQLGLAVNTLNWEHIYRMEGGAWVLDAGDSMAFTIACVGWLYSALAVAYAALLYLTLRREGKTEESRRALALTLALFILLSADSVRGMVGGIKGYAVNIGCLGYLAGVLLLVWSFRLPSVPQGIEP